MKAIIFSTESVEGLLSGRKTASRRVVRIPRDHAFEGAALARVRAWRPAHGELEWLPYRLTTEEWARATPQAK